MNRLLALALAVLCAVWGVQAAQSLPPQPRLTAQIITADLPDEITVELGIENNPGFAAMVIGMEVPGGELQAADARRTGIASRASVLTGPTVTLFQLGAIKGDGALCQIILDPGEAKEITFVCHQCVTMDETQIDVQPTAVVLNRN